MRLGRWRDGDTLTSSTTQARWYLKTASQSWTRIIIFIIIIIILLLLLIIIIILIIISNPNPVDPVACIACIACIILTIPVARCAFILTSSSTSTWYSVF